MGKGRRARSAGDGARRYNPPTVQPGKLNKVEALGASGTQDDQNANPGQAEVFEVGGRPSKCKSGAGWPSEGRHGACNAFQIGSD